MKRTVRNVLGALLVAVLAGGAVPATAGVNVNVNIGAPPVIVDVEPEMIAIPQTTVYFAPGVVGVDLFFHGGSWWTARDGRWYRGRGYNGPWVVVERHRVPREVVMVPRDYRTVYVREKHVPYGQLKKHWRHRERMREERRGEWRDWKEEKRERKHHEKEARRHMKEARKHDRGHDRDREYEHDRDYDRDRDHGRGRGRD